MKGDVYVVMSCCCHESYMLLHTVLLARALLLKAPGNDAAKGCG